MVEGSGIFVFPEDLEWIKAAGGYLWHVDQVPETGKYNPGQKAVLPDRCGFCGVADDCHGIDHVVSRRHLPASLVRWMYPLHALGFVAIFAFFFIHLYLGTIGNPGTVSAMITGWMDRACFENAASEMGQRDGA
ncbi:MAG: hypothetical protein MZV70_31745 [Desulfobacterales bacterium]|nr:hypothetical protein [Desulfobacterales bacterium]